MIGPLGFSTRRLPVVLLLVAANLSAAAADWPAWRYDAGRTAASPQELPAELRLQWTRELPAPRPAFPNDLRLCFDGCYEPIVTGRCVVLPSMVTDTVTALDSETGEERWTFFADAPVRFAPLAWEGRLYIVADDGCLYCLSADEGRLLWKFCGLDADRQPYKLLGNERLISRWPARGGPVLADGTIYFAAGLWPNEGVFVYAVDAATGRQVWVNDEGGLVKNGLLDHGTRRDGGLSPQGYLAVLGTKLIVPSGRALPAFFDRKSGKMDPYTTGWGGRIALAKGCWYVCGIGDYLFQSGDLYELNSPSRLTLASGSPNLQVSLSDFAAHMNTSPETARQWIERFGLDAGEQAGSPFVRVRAGGPVTYLSWWTFSKPESLRPEERQILESRVRLQVDPANVKDLGTFREPVLSRDAIYYSVPENEIGRRFRGEDLPLTNSPQYREIVACDAARPLTPSATYQGGWGSPHRLVQWPAARFDRAWTLPSDLKVHIKAGSRLYAGAPGTVAAVDLPAAAGQPRIGWRASIAGTPARMLAGGGKLLVVTAEGMLYCFGETPALSRNHPARPIDAAPSADTWTTRAREILEQAGVRNGYCLALGLGSGRLVEELARQSELQIIVIDSDAARVAASRKRFHAAGLYGSRIHVVPGDLQTLRLPPLMASLVVSEDLEGSGFDEQVATVERLFASLRPYGGAACLPVSELKHTALDQVMQSASIPGSRLARRANLTWLLREGALPDAADWQHESGDAAHTFASQDRAAKPPFGVLWFGGEIDRVLPPFKGPVPRIAAGRMFLQAGNELYAADIYTGRHLWRRPLGRAGQFVAADRELYAISGGVCLRLDPAKGELLGTIAVPASLDKTPGGWEEIRVAGDALIGVADKQLVCVDRTSGRLRWHFDAERDGISFAVGKDTVYCVDYWQPRHRRRGDAKSEEGTISSLDAGSGKVVWQTTAATPAVTEPPKPPDLPSLVSPQLAWCEASGVLLFTRNDSTAAAYQGATGKQLWAQELSCKDPPNAYTSASPPIVLSDCLVTHAGEVVDLVTGERRARMWKGMNSQLRGCGRALGSPCLITVRDAHLSCYDLAGGGHLYFRGIRSGCTNNLIPAGGILIAPHAMRHCTCNYAVATSLALVNMPEAGNWDTGGHDPIVPP